MLGGHSVSVETLLGRSEPGRFVKAPIITEVTLLPLPIVLEACFLVYGVSGRLSS